MRFALLQNLNLANLVDLVVCGTHTTSFELEHLQDPFLVPFIHFLLFGILLADAQLSPKFVVGAVLDPAHILAVKNAHEFGIAHSLAPFEFGAYRFPIVAHITRIQARKLWVFEEIAASVGP